MKNLANLNWSEKMALISHYKPTDEMACTVFGCSKDELAVAQNLQASGTFTAAANIDVGQYAQHFATNAVAVERTEATSKPVKAQRTVTVHSAEAPAEKPVTASKKVKEPQKRGRKGDKIQIAFQAIPANPVPVDAFMRQYGVSLAVLRQSKRFDKTGLGPVNVKQDKESKVLMIWREAGQ